VCNRREAIVPPGTLCRALQFLRSVVLTPLRNNGYIVPLLLFAGCLPSRPLVLHELPRAESPGTVTPAAAEPDVTADAEEAAQAARDLARNLIAEAARTTVTELTPRTLNHRNLWAKLGPVVDVAEDAHRIEIARSVEGRPLYAIEFGRGPVRVVLWSQMHGDEPTATLALADLVRYVVENRDNSVVRRLRERLTIVAIPMLNPDGAQYRRRENMLGVDVNRDARRQTTPEARALSAVHARLSPHFAFNLHDQSSHVGEDGRTVAISLLAPPHEPRQSDTPTRTRAKHVAAIMRMAADALVDGRVTRYDEAYNAHAFGDAMQSWGTSTILLETGMWEGDPGKTYLRKVNFALLVTALDAIATGSYEAARLNEYESLPRNRATQR
jgi:hypothetical protein